MVEHRRRRQTLLGLVILAFLVATARAEMLSDRLQDGRGAEVLIRARSFTPGDILLLTLEKGISLREVTVRFENQDYVLSAKVSGEKPLALIGLDLGLKPGPHAISASFVDRSGRTETVGRTLDIRPRKFVLKKLQLPEKFVFAPPEELERIRREAEMVAEVYSHPASGWLGDGMFILPLETRMMFNFGDRRIYNGARSGIHDGVDISAELGAPISASNAGRVVLAGDLYFSGNTVILDHGLGVFTLYLHMSRLLVRTGELVAKGQVLGEAGSTGRSTGPHLHWGVRIFKSRVDPRSLVRLPLMDWEK